MNTSTSIDAREATSIGVQPSVEQYIEGKPWHVSIGIFFRNHISGSNDLHLHLSPDQARAIAQHLIDTADEADKENAK